MQPIAVITAPAAGLIYINGRFAGEMTAEAPLMLPVNPQGVMYLEFRPFARRWRCSAHRFGFTGGTLTSGSADACYVIIWPENIYEIALTPLPAAAAESEFAVIDGVSAALLHGEASMLRIGEGSVALPDGAGLPHRHISVNGAELYMGRAGDEDYLAAFTSADHSPIDVITADTITQEDDGTFHAFSALGDTVGHARMDVYRAGAEGFETVSSEFMWAHGAPKWPATAEEAMLAALEAELLGLHGEAEGYLAPGLRGRGLLAAHVQGHEAALPLRYAAPNALPGAALIARISPRIARADPVHFHARPEGGPQGLWLIDKLSPPD